VQENILERHPDAELQVFAVWLPALATDERFEVADLMVDDRVRHFWDGERRVGEDVRELVDTPEGQLVWDVFLAFGPDARWRAALPTPLAVGAPVISASDDLAAALRPFLRG
jgi:hypothetical protein